MEGLWQHHQAFDGTYSFHDLMDVHEMLDIKQETNRRVRAAVDSLRQK